MLDHELLQGFHSWWALRVGDNVRTGRRPGSGVALLLSPVKGRPAVVSDASHPVQPKGTATLSPSIPRYEGDDHVGCQGAAAPPGPDRSGSCSEPADDELRKSRFRRSDPV